MNQERLVRMFNHSSIGNNLKKVVWKEIVANDYLLIIEEFGFIWPRKLAANEPFSYTISSKQLIIRNASGEVIKKIMLGNIQKMDPQQKLGEKLVMRLTIKKV